MSEHAALAAFERMNLQPIAVAPHCATLSRDLELLAAADPAVEHEKFLARRSELCAAYGFTDSNEQRKPFAFAAGVAIIPVTGSLINRFGQSYGSITGYNFVRTQHNLAQVDDDVKLIVFDHNTNGGEAAGCFECSDELFAARGRKPTIAVVDSKSYSAGYGLASAADKIVVTPSGGVGSIGVVAMHVDMSKALESHGFKVTLLTFGEHKADGNPFEALPKTVRDDLQASVNASGEKFVALVARNRGLDPKVIRDTQARTYRAEDALKLGLIDAIASPAEAIQAYLSELTGSTQQPKKEDSMSTEDQKPDLAAAATAAAEARTAERTRVAGIMNCDEAKGRAALANHLALNTDMPVDAAKGILAASPAESAAPAAAAEPAANPFKEAMDAGKHPNVGADGAAGGGELSAAEQILQAQAAATGIPLIK